MICHVTANAELIAKNSLDGNKFELGGDVEEDKSIPIFVFTVVSLKNAIRHAVHIVGVQSLDSRDYNFILWPRVLVNNQASE